MSPLWFLLVQVLVLRTAELRHVPTAPELQAGTEAPLPADPDGPDRAGGSYLRRVVRGTKDGGFRKRDPLPPRRHDDRSGFFFTSTPRTLRHTSALLRNSSSGGSGLHNPLFPVTGGSYCAYAVLLLALALFATGVVGNLALMCTVWHNVYLKSAWNCVLAGMAFWDLLVLFLCLPVVIFHELTLRRLLGNVTCRLVPYLEVTSMGVATFSLCALSIDRFHAATGPTPHQTPKAERCRSILSKVGVIWVGSMVLAAPELLLWQLLQETVGPQVQQNQHTASLMAALRGRGDPFQVDVCVREPSADLPEAIYALVLTYHEARVWWIFGCYLCLPLLFTLACDLVTQRVLIQQEPKNPSMKKNTSSSSDRERRLRAAVMALAILYATCILPHSIWNVALMYVPVPVLVLPTLGLVEHFLLFTRCSVAPVLLLWLCRWLGRAFMSCCCCCWEDCLHGNNSSSSSSASTAATSALPSPSSPSPSSLSPSTKEETIKIGSVAESMKNSAAAIGTPC